MTHYRIIGSIWLLFGVTGLALSASEFERHLRNGTNLTDGVFAIGFFALVTGSSLGLFKARAWARIGITVVATVLGLFCLSVIAIFGLGLGAAVFVAGFLGVIFSGYTIITAWILAPSAKFPMTLKTGCYALVLTFLLGSTAWIYWYVKCRDLPFDRQTWLNNGWRVVPDRPQIRVRMLKDLTQKYKIQEMRTNEIVALLGPPDGVSKETNGLIYWEYYVCSSEFVFDESYLSFDIDTNGHVIAVY